MMGFVGLVPHAASTAQTTLQFEADYASAPDFLRYHWFALQLHYCCCCRQADLPDSYQTEALVLIGDSESESAVARKHVPY